MDIVKYEEKYVLITAKDDVLSCVKDVQAAGIDLDIVLFSKKLIMGRCAAVIIDELKRIESVQEIEVDG